MVSCAVNNQKVNNLELCHARPRHVLVSVKSDNSLLLYIPTFFKVTATQTSMGVKSRTMYQNQIIILYLLSTRSLNTMFSNSSVFILFFFQAKKMLTDTKFAKIKLFSNRFHYCFQFFLLLNIYIAMIFIVKVKRKRA